ncbi:MAG TPA: RluA family pseudouridine synthase [Opitutaceae bacterium]|nr:RluA family pseudouridine synthase [Opitutaceae bacterium]
MSEIPPADIPASEPDNPFAKSKRACAWPQRVRPVRVRILTPDDLRSWIVYEDARLLVVSKPGDVVCHPSKAGPWSSLVGAVREYTQLPTVHLVFRLDRETSGIVVLAKDPKMASVLQTAMMERKIGKKYQAILTGNLTAAVTVDQPLGDDNGSPVFVKSTVRVDGQPSVTHFNPLVTGGGFTLALVVTETGRKHQIRAHAQWLGHTIVGDKIYGPDARCYLDFIDHGWTDALAAKLLLPRQALHCAEIDLRPAGLDHVFAAPLPEDLREFCRRAGINPPGSAPAGDRAV